MKIFEIALNDLRRSLRSAFFVGMAVIAPLVLTGLLYFAFNGISGGEVRLVAFQVGVVDRDRLPEGDSLLETPLGANIRAMFFDESVAAWIEARDYPDEAAARAALDRQEIGVAILIPPDLSARLLSGEDAPPVTILSDPTLSLAPAVSAEMVTMMLDGVTGGGVTIQTLDERLRVNGLSADPGELSTWALRYSDWYREFQRDLFHRPERSALRLVSLAADEGQAADPFKQIIALTMAGQMIFFAFFTAAYAMMSILRESEEGTLARLFSTPTVRAQILGGKFLAVLLTVSLQGVALLLAGGLAFGIQWGGALAVVLSLLGQALAASGLGVFLISFAKTTRQGGPVLGGVLTALGMLGGLFTANLPGGMPEAFNALANFTPQGWVLRAWKLSLAGAPPADLILPCLAALAFGAALFTFGALLFKRRYA